jgi:predicted nuclease with TOPRIM domain
MAKRSTIGENPLDAERSESPLDAVVPDLSAPRLGRAQELATEVKERLEKMEAGLKAAVAEAAQLRGWIAPLKDEAARATADAAQLKSELARLSGEMNRLKGELDGLKAEWSQLRAAGRMPSDIPWWMGGRKKG